MVLLYGSQVVVCGGFYEYGGVLAVEAAKYKVALGVKCGGEGGEVGEEYVAVDIGDEKVGFGGVGGGE